MEKLVLLFCIFSFLGGYAQENVLQEEEPTPISLLKKNEVSVNALYLLIFGAEFNYERTLNKDMGVGVSSQLFSYQKMDGAMNFHLSPFARYYFGKKPVSGFFVEGFASLFNKSYEPYVSGEGMFYRDVPLKSHTSVGFGFGLGAKWVKRSGFTFELNWGVGREPRATTDENPPFFVKGGVRVGLKF